METNSLQLRLLVTAIVLLAMWHPVADAAFTERFDTVVNEKITGPSRFWEVQPTPFLWARRGNIEKGGRAAPADRYSMTLSSSSGFGALPPMVAETALLDWDGTNTTLSFFHLLKYRDCPDTAPVVQLAWSTDRQSWTVLWNSSGSWSDANQWVGVRVPLPVSAATPQIALKWINNDEGTGTYMKIRCSEAYLDDIVFPAKAPTSDNMGLGKAAGPLESDSFECKACKDVCVPVLQREAEDRAAASNVLGRPGLGG
jgi:hypothetical protein